MLVGGYVSTAVLSSAIGAAVAPWQAGVFRAAAWTACGLRVPARNALLAGPLGRLLAGVAAFEIGNCASTLLILRATDLFAARYGRTAAAQLAVLLYVGYNVAAALISVPAGRPGPGAGRRGGAVRSRVRLVRGRPRPSRCCCPRSC